MCIRDSFSTGPAVKPPPDALPRKFTFFIIFLALSKYTLLVLFSSIVGKGNPFDKSSESWNNKFDSLKSFENQVSEIIGSYQNR